MLHLTRIPYTMWTPSTTDRFYVNPAMVPKYQLGTGYGARKPKIPPWSPA